MHESKKRSAAASSLAQSRSPIHRVRGVPRSIEPSSPTPATTVSSRRFSPRRTSCMCRPSGQATNASTVVAGASRWRLRSYATEPACAASGAVERPSLEHP